MLIFDTQIQINSFVKDQLHYFDSVSDVVDFYNLHFVKNIDTSNTDIEYRHHLFIDTLLVSNHGVVKDKFGTPIKPFINKGIQWIKLKDSAGVWRKKRVSTMMIDAFYGAKRSSYKTPYKINTLSNLEYKLSVVSVSKVFSFKSQSELGGLLYSFNIESVSEMMSHMNLSFGKCQDMISGYAFDKCDDDVITAEYTLNGVRYKVNNYGFVLQYKNGWKPTRKPFLKKGRLVFRYINNNGVISEIGIASLMIKAFNSIDERVIVRYTDNNPYNLCMRNLRW